MSQAKNKNRWELPQGITLRKGQKQALKVIEQKPQQSEFVFVLPTGYGKSFVTLLSYQMAREQGRCSRLLIVVATGIQREQYARDLAADANRLGIQLLGGSLCVRECNGEGFVIRSHLKNLCEVFVTTVQSLNPKNIGFYHDLMSKGNWMIVADEAHHYSDTNLWGQSVKQLPAEIRIGLTATPSRSDNQDLVVGGGKSYDVEVTTEEAIQEGALRPFRLEVGDYEVDLISGDQVQTYSLSELQQEWGQLDFKNITEWEIKRQCRYSAKYIQSIFVQAYNIYNHLELLYPKSNQILIFAWSCEHAKNVSKQINSLAGDNSFADWIGTNGRTPEENDAVLKRFLAEDDYLPCLVQVNKASEGFNNPRCTVGIFLNAINPDTPMLLQQLGRFMRVQKEGSPNAVILVGKDHPLADADLSGLGQVTKNDLDGTGTDPYITSDIDGKYKIKIPPLSEIFVTVKKLLGFESKYPFGDQPENIADNLIKKGLYSPDDRQSLLENILLLQEEKRGLSSQSSTTHREQRDALRRQVKIAVSRLVTQALEQTIYPQKILGSVKGDWIRKTNTHLSKVFGKTEDLDIEDLRRKYEYVTQIANDINESQEVPSWMIP